MQHLQGQQVLAPPKLPSLTHNLFRLQKVADLTARNDQLFNNRVLDFSQRWMQARFSLLQELLTGFRWPQVANLAKVDVNLESSTREAAGGELVLWASLDLVLGDEWRQIIY